MSTIPEGLTQADFDRYAKLDSGIKKLEDEKKILADKIKAALPLKKEVYVFEDVILDASVRKGQFDKVLASQTFPAAEYPEYYTAVIDATKVRKSLGEAADSLNGESSLTLSVKVSKAS